MKSRRLICLFLSAIIMLSTVVVNAQNQDVFDIISDAVASSEVYIGNEITSLGDNGGLTYGFEWYVISMLRAGKNVDQGIMENYLDSLADAVSGWTENTKPSDMERTALALSVMGEDITEFNGVDIAKHIYNSSRLADTSTELAYALLALDAKDTQIPENAFWQREDITQVLLDYALENGGFSLNKGGRADIDVTAICISALAPYMDDENIKATIDMAVDFLGDTISEEFNYADNPNTTAQVLMALSVLGIDVTNSEFGNSEQNIITALEKYRNPDGNGYVYQGSENAMATLQIMQAYDAYRKMMLEGVSYWDFLQTGENYDDKTHNNPDDSQDKEEAQPATVYVTIASGGVIAAGKDGVLMAQMPVTVTDIDEDGILTVDEALFCAHESYYDGGAESGYLLYNSTYGLSLARLWGKGSIEEPTAAGYWLNNVSCMSLSDEVEEGDFLTAFNYCDTLYWSDAYSYFTNNTVSVTKGESAVLELRFLSGYDADNGYAPVFSPCTDAVIKKLGTDEVYTTDENGCVMIDTSDMDEGEYRFASFGQDGTLVPAVCVLSVNDVSGEEKKSAEVYVTVSIGGMIAEGKNGVLMAQMPVTVTDIDVDGNLTVDEALFCAHESYYDGGAESGYLSYNSTYGLSLAKLWGKGSIEEPTAAGYWLNNVSCMSLADSVKEGDFLNAFNYCDTVYWSDAYSYFVNNSVNVTKGESAVLELRFLSGYDADNGYAPVFSPCTDAKVKELGTEEIYTTDDDGCVKIDTDNMERGTYRFISFKDDGTLVPAVCILTVTEDNPDDSGSHGGTDTIRVHLRIADPKGKTYLAKKAYSVEKKTTVYELLCKTNLDIETSKSPYGVYIVSIEGLSEFDDGSESGWVFTVNGKRPDISVDSYRLSNGDYVEVLYTRELGNDVGDGKISAGSSSGASYTVKFDTDGGGSVDSQKIKKNGYLIVPKEPVKEGYTFLGWYIDTKLSKEYSFDNKVTKNMILYAKWQKNEQIKLPFDDVRKEDAFYNGVCFVYEKGIMQGTDNGFAPDGYITREMFATILWRFDGCPNVKNEDAFEDVTDGSWYSLAVNWAKDKGITLGVGNKLFGVSRKITKEEMIVMMYRYCVLKGVAGLQNATDYIHSAITWAEENKIVSEANASATVTRAETTVILKNLYEVISK